MRYTDDPLAGSIAAQAQHAAALGLLHPLSGLAGLFDLAPLDVQLKASGLRPVSP